MFSTSVAFAPDKAAGSQISDEPKVVTQVKATPAECADKECITKLIVKYSKKYEVDQNLSLAVAKCESQLNPVAVGDSGKAYGVYQFHKPTFDMFSKMMREKLNYKSTEDNIKVAVWALSNGLEDHWTCYEKVTKE